MAEITFHGKPIQTIGTLPELNSQAPEFTLTNKDLEDVSLNDFTNTTKVLNIVPSLDTPVCASSTRWFSQEVSKRPEIVLLAISADLPFAQNRFCDAEKIENAKTLSTFRSNFGHDYGVQIADGALSGLLSRAVVILSAENKVIYTEQVPEISEEPDYQAILTLLKSL